MSSTTTGSDIAGAVWFGELSAVLRGKKRQPTPTESHGEHQLQQLGGAVRGKTKAGAAAKPSVERKETGAGGGMSDATVYMLFDRFAPS